MHPLHAALTLAISLPAAATGSQLRGRTGESWDPAGRRPDFSCADDPGYVSSCGGRWFEAIPPAELRPRILHQAQWERRMGVMK